MNFRLRFLLTVAFSTLAIHATYGDEIINGGKAKKNTLQYMASVQCDRKHICGGALIDDRYVLTAAHCDKSGNMSVILGTQDINPQGKNLKRYSVIRKYKYPSYKNPKNGADIMLLRLSEKVQLKNGVKLIKIPSMNKSVNSKTKCLVAGWGSDGQQKMVNNLLVTDVSTINVKVCQEQWAKASVSLPQNILCAGGYRTKSGACQGDSGGPLVCNDLAVGIVSFNLRGNCQYPNVPNVYTQISKYTDWIKKVIKKGD
ncbi:kallikrein-7 [Trichomycterus rosablanca]|uniref:kallikrein-7 n=1 Tax=Trichomycterus rosablanca TaxID=2290929 RepID=UPI002F35F45D